ncbi:hypothetical protein FAJ36_10735 [Streptococcus suis]|uniref:Uncharacterized protein n=1 Tax=Streptococcus suis TaxID=1307 RepID=A0A4T2GWS1_STRSU|nr:hypothetical protein FAJ36_10735 [Streptococcus suis]
MIYSIWPLSNVSFVAFHYRSYGAFTFKRLHSGFTRYRNYRTIFCPSSVHLSHTLRIMTD